MPQGVSQNVQNYPTVEVPTISIYIGWTRTNVCLHATLIDTQVDTLACYLPIVTSNLNARFVSFPFTLHPKHFFVGSK